MLLLLLALVATSLVLLLLPLVRLLLLPTAAVARSCCRLEATSSPTLSHVTPLPCAHVMCSQETES